MSAYDKNKLWCNIFFSQEWSFSGFGTQFTFSNHGKPLCFSLTNPWIKKKRKGKKALKVTKTFLSLLSPDPRPLYIAPGKCVVATIGPLLPFSKCLSSFPYRWQTEGKDSMWGFFFPRPFSRYLEAVGNEGRIRHPSLNYSVFWHRFEPPYVRCLRLRFPKVQKQSFHNRVTGS